MIIGTTTQQVIQLHSKNFFLVEPLDIEQAWDYMYTVVTMSTMIIGVALSPEVGYGSTCVNCTRISQQTVLHTVLMQPFNKRSPLRIVQLYVFNLNTHG